MSALLAAHPEAVSLLTEASHHQSLAEYSAAAASQKFTEMQAARLAHENLRHRLDPRHRRSLHFMAALALLAAIAAGIAVISGAELTGLLAPSIVAPAAAAVTAVWLTGAWLAVLASRDRRRGLLAVLAAVGSAASLLLAAVRVATALPRWSPVWIGAGASVLGSVLIAVLAAGESALIARMEPASVFLGRQALQRARAGHREAVRLEQADAEAATVARDAWLGFVRSHGAGLVGGQGQRLVQDSVIFAATLQEAGRRRLGPAPDDPEPPGHGGPP